MNWKYWFLHGWPEGKRMTEADLQLIPDDPNYEGLMSLWVTVDCLAAVDTEQDPDIRAWKEMANKKLGKNNYWIKGENDDDSLGASNMIIRVNNFSKKELLNWVKVWIKAKGLPVSELVHAPHEIIVVTEYSTDMLDTLIEEYGKKDNPCHLN